MLSTNPVTTTLIKAREMIADPARWTQFRLHSPERMAHCALGAVEIAANHDWRREWSTIKRLHCAAQEIFGFADAVRVNNCLGHAATLQMFDRAIENSFRGPDQAAR